MKQTKLYYIIFFTIITIGCAKWDLDKIEIQASNITKPPAGTPTSASAITNDLNKIYFSSNLVGYIAGKNVVLKTINGGNTWTRLKENSAINYTAVNFVDDNKGFLGGNDQYYNYLYATTDGGLTWKEINKNWYQNNYAEIGDIFYGNNTVFYLSNYYPNATQVYGYLYYSNDNGSNWKILAPSNGSGRQGLNCATYNNGITLIGGTTYWDGTKYFGGTQTILNLSNPTLNLSKIDLVASINGISLYNNKAIAVGDDGSLSLSSDKGSSWTSKTIPNYSNINFKAVKIIDDLNYYLAGDNSTLLKSTDAGLSWTRITTNGNYTLNSFSYKDNGELYLVGNSGQIIKVK
jgi:photosystem II stability/assembly factor-like uncharacterized protein